MYKEKIKELLLSTGRKGEKGRRESCKMRVPEAE